MAVGRHTGRPLRLINIVKLGAVNPFGHPHNIEENHLFNDLGSSWWT